MLAAEIEGRPITDHEILGVIQLLILGGLETTAGALGQFMIRFCRRAGHPGTCCAAEPELLPDAVEELLRLDPPFIAIARTATCDTEIGGQRIEAGQRVLIYWASANRDEAEFACPHAFDLDRASNRHLSFGAGPHRCAGSNLARMNLRIALEELSAAAARRPPGRRRRADPLPLGAQPVARSRARSRSPREVRREHRGSPGGRPPGPAHQRPGRRLLGRPHRAARSTATC